MHTQSFSASANLAADYAHGLLADVCPALLLHVQVLYYEALDMPLPELEQLKTLRVRFHDEHTAFVGEHVIRLPRDSSVGDVLEELRGRLAEQYKQRRLRLMEVYNRWVADSPVGMSAAAHAVWRLLPAKGHGATCHGIAASSRKPLKGCMPRAPTTCLTIHLMYRQGKQNGLDDCSQCCL